jgi:hypothetical protein
VTTIHNRSRDLPVSRERLGLAGHTEPNGDDYVAASGEVSAGIATYRGSFTAAVHYAVSC